MSPRAAFDIAYGAHERQKLDLYRPGDQSGQPAPIAIYFYGGSWKSGSRRIYRFLGKALARCGFLAAIPDYRLYPEIRFPAFLEDAAAAIAHVRRAAGTWGGDAQRIVLIGHSAGAHIAVTLGLDHRYLGAAGVAPDCIAGLVGLAGPYSFNPLETESVRDIFQHHEPISDARPIKLVHGAAPPALLLHGGRDKTVGKHNTEHLSAALREAGATVRTRIYDSLGHIEIMAALAWPYRWRATVFRDLVAFAEDVTGPDRSSGTPELKRAAEAAARVIA